MHGYWKHSSLCYELQDFLKTGGGEPAEYHCEHVSISNRIVTRDDASRSNGFFPHFINNDAAGLLYGHRYTRTDHCRDQGTHPIPQVIVWSTVMKARKYQKRVAHFLLIPELLYSPPNHAIITTWIDLGFQVHIFSPGNIEKATSYGNNVVTHQIEYTMRWLIRNAVRKFWFSISCFSGTSEDPLAVVGALAYIYRRPSFLLVDEIRAGAYRGNSPERWKQLSRWSMRRSNFNIVNDFSRIDLLREYAQLPAKAKVIVYPGCFFRPPVPDRELRPTLRRQWNLPADSLIIASSGGFNLKLGADWLIQSLIDDKSLHAVIQPLGISPLAYFLLKQLNLDDRLYLQEKRMSWSDAWQSAVGFDIGMAVYTDRAPQFQNMGISSNRLCMFIAMGVPVICSRQKSFEFVEKFSCGVMVETYTEFMDAIHYIRDNLDFMRSNCRTALHEYIMYPDRYSNLKSSIAELVS